MSKTRNKKMELKFKKYLRDVCLAEDDYKPKNWKQ